MLSALTVPPSIDEDKSTPNQVSINVGGIVNLYCHISGTPKPSVAWLINGRPLDDTGLSPRIRVVADGHQLEIADVEVADTTRYTCIAKNDAGVADRDFDLTVLGKKLPIISNSSHTSNRSGTLTIGVSPHKKIYLKFPIKINNPRFFCIVTF